MANSHRLFCVFFWLNIRFSIQIKKTYKNFCEIPRQTARNFPIIVRGVKNFCKTPRQNVLLMSIYDREIIYLSWTRKNKNGEKNKMKEAEKWSRTQVENVFFKSVFQCMTDRKTLEANAEQNLEYWAKCSTLYFASQNSVLCEAVNPLIKQ